MFRVCGMGLTKGILSAARPFRALAQAVGTETDRSAARTYYLAKWPMPPQTSVPAWAGPGKVRFARWDGGALEVSKAILSGWPEFSPVQPEYVDTMAGWYSPRTIEFLRQAHINTIWVTFSNGFSNQTERQQQETLRGYIAACHRFGIHTIAYESLTNMFFEDMFARVPDSRNWLSHDKQGNPISYGAADYKRAGHVCRYLADLSNPDWRSYLRGRIDLAIEAGADGVMYDNCFGSNLVEVFEELVPYALSKKKDFQVMVNFHREQFVYNRMLNAITTTSPLTVPVEGARHTRVQFRRFAGSTHHDRKPIGTGFRSMNALLKSQAKGVSFSLPARGPQEFFPGQSRGIDLSAPR
jgi:hypothetical protein